MRIESRRFAFACFRMLSGEESATAPRSDHIRASVIFSGPLAGSEERSAGRYGSGNDDHVLLNPSGRHHISSGMPNLNEGGIALTQSK